MAKIVKILNRLPYRTGIDTDGEDLETRTPSMYGTAIVQTPIADSSRLPTCPRESSNWIFLGTIRSNHQNRNFAP